SIIPCGPLSHTVGPSVRENIDFFRHLGIDGQILRTEKSF
ncbi:Os02g0453500, partial [Oryza sativa Japonica Group]